MNVAVQIDAVRQVERNRCEFPTYRRERAGRQAGELGTGRRVMGMESASVNARHQHRYEGGEYRRIELFTGSSRRRRWSAAEKAAIVAESLKPGVNISELARLCGINRGLAHMASGGTAGGERRRGSVLAQYHQGQVTVPRLLAQLQARWCREVG